MKITHRGGGEYRVDSRTSHMHTVVFVSKNTKLLEMSQNLGGFGLTCIQRAMALEILGSPLPKETAEMLGVEFESKVERKI